MSEITPLSASAPAPRSLHGKTLFITGASRGIGLAIAKRAAADGANIVIVAKTTDTNPKLPGTIYSAAQEIEAAGGKALPLAVDIREEDAVMAAVAKAGRNPQVLTMSPPLSMHTHWFQNHTAAMQMIPGVDIALCRKPEILSDAAWFILTGASTNTGNFYIDDTVLAANGITDLETYSVTPGTKNFIPDFFVD